MPRLASITSWVWFVMLLLVIHSSCASEKKEGEPSITAVLHEMDTMSIEGLSDDDLNPKVREFKQKFTEKIAQLRTSIKSSLDRVKEQMKTIYAAFKEEATIESTHFMQENAEIKHLHFLEESWSKMKEGVTALLTSLKEHTKASEDHKKELDTLLADYEQHVEPSSAEQWQKAKLKAQAKVDKVMDTLNRPLEDLTRKWTTLFDHVKSKGGIGHKPHYPVLECKKCGKLYSLGEFLNVFDHDHNLLITEEAHWTDEQVKEFYEGWSVWANHMKIKCTNCGASDWQDITFVENEVPEQPAYKDEL